MRTAAGSGWQRTDVRQAMTMKAYGHSSSTVKDLAGRLGPVAGNDHITMLLALIERSGPDRPAQQDHPEAPFLIGSKPRVARRVVVVGGSSPTHGGRRDRNIIRMPFSSCSCSAPSRRCLRRAALSGNPLPDPRSGALAVGHGRKHPCQRRLGVGAGTCIRAVEALPFCVVRPRTT